MSMPALIALGSNLGDRKALLDCAIAGLRETAGVTVRAVSTYHESTAVGGPGGQGQFLNAAASLETTLNPPALLRQLQQIEQSAGRLRSVRWGERTLDLDLLLHADHVIDTPELRLPHPRMSVRRFVLAPSAEVAPDAIDPLTGRTVRQLLDNVDRRPGCVAVVGDGSEAVRSRLVPALGSFDGAQEGRSEPSPDWYALLGRKADESAARRFASEGWVVLPFWFDLIYREALPFVDDPERWHSEFLLARERVIRPTFVVATDAYTYARLRLWNDLNRDFRPIGRDAPVLWPRPDQPMTALSGLDWKSIASITTPTDAEIESMTSEIVTACAATRSG